MLVFAPIFWLVDLCVEAFYLTAVIVGLVVIWSAFHKADYESGLLFEGQGLVVEVREVIILVASQ